MNEKILKIQENNFFGEQALFFKKKELLFSFTAHSAEVELYFTPLSTFKTNRKYKNVFKTLEKISKNRMRFMLERTEILKKPQKDKKKKM